MLTAILISTALLIITIAILVACSAMRRFSAKRRDGLKRISQLFQLLEIIPQHRGMSNALLQGNLSFKDKRHTLQGKIDSQLESLSKEYPELVTMMRFKAIQHDWDSITQNFSSLTGPQSFTQHTCVIAQLLELISDIGNQSKLHNSQDPKLRDLLEIGINILPPVTEALGQARGIGAGAATQEKLSPQNRSKLRYLHNQANTICQNTAEILGQNQASSGTIDFTQCQKSIGEFLHTLDAELLNAEQITIESELYFSIASDAIGHSFEQLYQVINQASMALDQECGGVNRRLNIARVSTLASGALLLTLLLP